MYALDQIHPFYDQLNQDEIGLRQQKVLYLTLASHYALGLFGLVIKCEKLVFADDNVQPQVVKLLNEVYLLAYIKLPQNVEVFINFYVALVHDVQRVCLDMLSKFEP